ncbi:MAG TPA: protein phosphatase 2C domain-containing protein [Paucimonas sp.]|nr:protein phosphatase 2C domain-containing protein [Paucimonas sp.]
MRSTEKPAARFRWTSASRTDVGCVRERNEDACLDRPARGLWAIADGMGGHALGDLASRTVVECLDALAAPSDLQRFVGDARRQLQEANRRLRAEAALRNAYVIGSTVVALLARDEQCAYLWAGDSRLYLRRNGRLVQLTRDHCQEDDQHRRAGHMITRAVGAADALNIDQGAVYVEDGDVFLLCSDGLSNAVGDDDIGALLAEGDCQRAADQLVRLALEHGGRDNVSVVVMRVEDLEGDDKTVLNPAL